MTDGYARDGRRGRVTDLGWKTGARRVTETGALWRGYGRLAASRKWDGSVPYRAGLDSADGHGFFAVEDGAQGDGPDRRSGPPEVPKGCLIAEVLGG
jgi:hypothetical protein